MLTIFYRNRFSCVGLLCLLIVVLAACSGGSGKSGKPGATRTAYVTATSSATAAATPTLKVGAQTCPDTVQAPLYWDSVVGTQPDVSHVETVTCAYLRGGTSLQALVTVRYDGSGGLLDIYVYDNLASATPLQLFKLQNLYQGQAKISAYNTVLTAEVDRNSSLNAQKSDAVLTRDLFREFKWSSAIGTLVQIVFPGIFPDLTRYQAETDQAQVNAGQQTWKLSAQLTAQAFGAKLLHWSASAPATLVSGGGSADLQALVNLKDTSVGGSTIEISLMRLEGKPGTGIWLVVSVRATGLAITSPQSAELLASQFTVTGTGFAFASVIGTLTVLDHLYNDIGHTTVHGVAGEGNTTFSTSLTSHSTFTSGAQEGLIWLATRNSAGGAPSAAVFVKLLIQ